MYSIQQHFKCIRNVGSVVKLKFKLPVKKTLYRSARNGPVYRISNLADEDDDQLIDADNSDEELDESGDEVEDQEEGDNSAGDDDDDDGDDNNIENSEEESSEDDNGSDLESEGEKYNA